MSFNLSLTPPQLEVVAPVAKTITQVFTVTNNSPDPIYLTTSTARWQPVGVDGSVEYIADPTPTISFSLLNADLKLGQPFNLSPHQSQQLVLQITPSHPNTDAYYTFFVNQVPSSPAAAPTETSSQVTGRIGSHLLISSSPASTARHAQINDFSSTPRVKDVFLSPITFSATIHNSSPNYFKINGKITITKNGQTIKEFSLLPDNVLANHSRSLRCLDRDLPAPCTLPPPLWPGFYTAQLQLDPSLQTLPTTISFFVFPFSPLIILTLLLILSFYIKFRSTT